MTLAADTLKLVQRLRTTEFPWTAERVYLNNASIGPIPERTRRTLDVFNARRTAPYSLSDEELMRILSDGRSVAARLIGATIDEIALAQNTSYGLNAAASALPFASGDIVLLSDGEFPANVFPWLLLRARGVEAELVPCLPSGWPDEDRLLERLSDPRVRVLTISSVQFSSGYAADLDRLSAACRATDTLLCVDAIQGLGHVPLDVSRTSIDILACGGQKWLLSPWGSGFLYVRSELISQLRPTFTGWMAFEGTDDFRRLTAYDAELRETARRFELHTLPFQDVYGMTRSIEMLVDIGIGRIASYLDELYAFMLHWADERGITVVSPRETTHRAGIFCFRPRDPQRAHQALVDAGVVCSLREDALRLSPHVYNTVDELERVIDVLEGDQLSRTPSVGKG